MVLNALEVFLAQYAVPLAVVDLRSLAGIVEHTGLREHLTKDDMMPLFQNREDVAQIIQKPVSV